MTLPSLRRLRPGDLARFDLRHGLPVAWRVLRAELGAATAARALAAYARRSVSDPLAGLPIRGWPLHDEKLVRRQFRAAVIFDDVAREDLGLPDDRAEALVRDLVAETGARFVQRNAPLQMADAWRSASEQERGRFAGQLLRRFFNMRAERVETGPERFDFDVTVCRFAQLARDSGRPHLGPMFCEADSRLFDRRDVPVQLRRTGTIARGDGVCDFRFRYQ